MSPAPVSVIIPTWDRLDDLQQTLSVIKSCDPAPEEIIVHVDAGDTETAPWLQHHAPDVRVLQSSVQVGAPGGRNKLMDAARAPYVASFDDDSFPEDTDYFARVVRLFEAHPMVGVLDAVITHRNEDPEPETDAFHRVADFIGCGCALRAEAWKDTNGYVDRPLASQGIEEPDLSLQLLDAGWSIAHSGELRVFHNTDLKHHDSPAMTAATLANRALLAYLRYPLSHWSLGALQYMNRIRWSIRHGRRAGLLRGIRETLPLLWKHRNEREPVSAETLEAYRQLQKNK